MGGVTAFLCGTDEIPEFGLLIQRHYRPRMAPFPVFADSTLRRLSMPVLLIVGGKDRLFDSGDTRRRMAQAVPHATVLDLPGAGHLLPRQTDAVLEFLSAQGKSED